MKRLTQEETAREISNSLGISPEDFDDYYLGKFNSRREFIDWVIESNGPIVSPEYEFYLDYINFSHFARKYIESHGIISVRGHYFNSPDQ